MADKIIAIIWTLTTFLMVIGAFSNGDWFATYFSATTTWYALQRFDV